MRRPSEREFGLVVAGLLGVIALIGGVFFAAFYPVPLALSLGFAAVALVAPTLLLPLSRLWMLVAGRLMVLTNYLVLGAVLYSVFTPVRVLMAAFRHDPMQRRRSKGDSYFTRPPRVVSRDTYRDQF